MDLGIIIKDVWKPLREIVEKLGYECVGINLVTEENTVFLRVYIDSLGGILVRDCEIVSKAISAFLDENENLVPGKFFLEVSSPGIERPLFTMEDYARFVGKKARLKVRMPVLGRKSITGVILTVEENSIVLEIESEKNGEPIEARVDFETITRANLVFEEKKEKRRNS